MLAACGGGGGGGSNPPPPQVPTVTLTASPTSVTSGGTVTLTWSATNNPSSCTASGSWSGIRADRGPRFPAALTANASFGLSCTNAAGTGTGTTNVTVTPPPAGSGLDQRPNNTDCVAPPRPTGSSTVSVQRAFPNLASVEPVALLQAPGNATRWFLIEKAGVIRAFDNVPTVATAQVFLDIRDRVIRLGECECGLLGIALHPNFAVNGRAYVNYIDGMTRSITPSEFTSSDGGLTLNPNSERILLTVNKPADNHNGGQLRLVRTVSYTSASATVVAAAIRRRMRRTR